MTTTLTETEPTNQVTGKEYVQGIRSLIESGEIANVPEWGDGKFFLGDGKGNWHYESFIVMFKALHGAMREVNPSLPEALPPHCMDPKFISDTFKIPLDKLNAPATIKPARPEPPRKPSIPSPYLDAQQAADYLGMTVKALYGHVDRRKLRPMPGYKKYRFTKEQLDAFLRGEKPK
jgi:excisionase family DNA binding protein